MVGNVGDPIEKELHHSGADFMSKLMATIVLVAVGMISACTSFQRASDQIPGASVRFAELTRSEYRIGNRVSGKATVRVRKTMLQKVLPFVFGNEIVSEDQIITPGFLTIDETTIKGVRAPSSAQLSDLIAGVLRQLTDLGISASSSAVGYATSAAYMRALKKVPNADSLLEPRIEVTRNGTSSLLFFVTDDETVTVVVTGRPVTIVADGSQGGGGTAASIPAATSPPPAGPQAAANEAISGLPIGRQTLLELPAATVRTLKEWIGKKVEVRLASGEVASGILQQVERAGLTVNGKTLTWDTTVSVEGPR